MAPIESVSSVAQAVRSGRNTAVEVVGDCLDRIAAVDAGLNCFLRVDREKALAAAERIDSAVKRGDSVGPLAGVPLGVKDNICTIDGPTTCGSRMLKSFRPIRDATVIERLKAAGAIMVGKTNLDEFGMGSSTEYGAFGRTKNPWDEARVPGGSSGGSAAAVAARLVPGALGSDTGGSIRLPASFCGVVGVKPSYGRVSRCGLVAFGSSLDQVGPLTTNVRDAALLLGVMAGHDDLDSTSVDAVVPDYLSGLDQSLEGVRIGISSEYFGAGLDDVVRSAVEAAIEAMKAQGARPVTIDLPHMKYAVACYYMVSSAEASSNLARYDGVHFGHRADAPRDIFDLYESSRGEGFGPEVKRRIMLGTYALSAGYYDAYYLKALKVRTLIKRDFEAAFRHVDVIASPVSPTPAFASGEKVQDPLAMYLMDIYTISANLAGLCAVSCPCGFSDDGLPIGLQLMGPAFGEARLLAVAHQYQQLTDYHSTCPPTSACAG